MRRQRPPLPSFVPDFLRPAPVIKPPPNPKPPTAGARRPSHNATVMGQIPPTANPRGELIFSSRVDKTFKEGYERYRAAFERRREEKAREEARRNKRLWFRRGVEPIGRVLTPTPPVSRRNTPPPGVNSATLTNGTRRGRSPSPGPSHLSTVEASETRESPRRTKADES